MKLIACNSGEKYEVIADSALVLPGRPTFIPDLPGAESWQAELMYAARISRLGKSVSAKFAVRFHDGITLAARLVPLNADGSWMEGIMSVIDFGITLGEWLEELLPGNGTMDIEFAGEKKRIDRITDAVESAIVNLSRHTTLKMGDILLLPAPFNPVPVKIGDEITGTANGRLILKARFK